MVAEIKEPIEEIKELYSQINRKTEFMVELAKALGKRPNTLKNHWFTLFWSIPIELELFVLEFLKEKIKSQKQHADI